LNNFDLNEPSLQLTSFNVSNNNVPNNNVPNNNVPNSNVPTTTSPSIRRHPPIKPKMANKRTSDGAQKAYNNPSQYTPQPPPPQLPPRIWRPTANASTSTITYNPPSTSLVGHIKSWAVVLRRTRNIPKPHLPPDIFTTTPYNMALHAPREVHTLKIPIPAEYPPGLLHDHYTLNVGEHPTWNADLQQDLPTELRVMGWGFDRTSMERARLTYYSAARDMPRSRPVDERGVQVLGGWGLRSFVRLDDMGREVGKEIMPRRKAFKWCWVVEWWDVVEVPLAVERRTGLEGYMGVRMGGVNVGGGQMGGGYMPGGYV
jgi:hypothetical protein